MAGEGGVVGVGGRGTTDLPRTGVQKGARRETFTKEAARLKEGDGQGDSTQYEQHVSFPRSPFPLLQPRCMFSFLLSVVFFRGASTDWAVSLGTLSISQSATPPPGDQ